MNTANFVLEIFVLVCWVLGAGCSWFGWNFGLCLWDIEFASCNTHSSNRGWAGVVWAWVHIFRKGDNWQPSFAITVLKVEQLFNMFFMGFKECDGKPKINYVTVFERPGLHQFLKQLSEFADLVLFTAGLEGEVINYFIYSSFDHFLWTKYFIYIWFQVSSMVIVFLQAMPGPLWTK